MESILTGPANSRKGLTIYEMAFIVVERYRAEKRAKAWLQNKQ